MPPNFNEFAGTSPNFVESPKDNGPAVEATSSSSVPVTLRVVRSLTTLLAHMLIGIITGISLLFAFRGRVLPLNGLNQHVILCVVGFQLLMAEAMLALAPDSWLSTLNLKHKRWVHSVMQVVGSVLALVGCFIMIGEKTVHWDTLHGQFALVSMVFTTVSLVNGLTSLYAHPLRRFIPAILSRLTHICFGIVALGAASISLAYGFDKGMFRNWAWTAWGDTIIVMTGIMTVIVIINPFITFFSKFVAQFKN